MNHLSESENNCERSIHQSPLLVDIIYNYRQSAPKKGEFSRGPGRTALIGKVPLARRLVKHNLLAAPNWLHSGALGNLQTAHTHFTCPP